MARQERDDLCIDHPDVIRLCTTCSRYRCPGICDAYRAKVREIQGIDAPERPAFTAQRGDYKQKYLAYGQALTLKQWSLRTGISYGTLYNRMHRQGLTLEQAIEKETRKGAKNNVRLITYNGETKPLIKWARETGMLPTTLRLRLDRGWTVERALNTPVRRDKDGDDYYTP